MRTDANTFQLLQNALSATQMRQQAYANNIANVNTPGYKREDVQFESLLNATMGETPAAQVGQSYIPISSMGQFNLPVDASGIMPILVQDSSSTVSNNGNNVDVDAEMAKMAENQIESNGLTQDMSLRLLRMKIAITGGP